MRQVSITEFKKLTATEIKAMLPVTITADGLPVAVVQLDYKPPSGKTKCPNCKLEYQVALPDGKQFFFTGKHPK